MRERIIAGVKTLRSQEETGFSEQVEEELAFCRSRAISLGRKGREGIHTPSHAVDGVKDKGIPTWLFLFLAWTRGQGDHEKWEEELWREMKGLSSNSRQWESSQTRKVYEDCSVVRRDESYDQESGGVRWSKVQIKLQKGEEMGPGSHS